jgi:hypothetical protein
MNRGSPGSLEQAVEAARPLVEHAQRILETHEDGDFLPTFFLFTAERGVDIIGIHYCSDDEKRRAATLMRAQAMLAVPLGLWGVMFISDSRLWDIDACAKEQGVSVELLARRIKEDPEFIRRHIKQIDCLTARLETYLGDWDVLIKYQRETDRVIWHPPQSMTARGCTSEGRMVGFLPPLPSHGVSA